MVRGRFAIEVADDGTLSKILRDGLPSDSGVRLEQLYTVPSVYFRAAAANLLQMRGIERAEDRRSFGLQSFLMALLGVEAFTNTYFLLRGHELGNTGIAERVASHGTLSRRLRGLIELTGDGPIKDQKLLLDKVFELSSLRHAVVHPRWVPSSVTLPGVPRVIIDGMIDNYHAVFEDADFCEESLNWCLLIVARIGVGRGHEDMSGFMFHWTGNYGLTEEAITARLRLYGET